MKVKKHSGELIEFEIEKLQTSLHNVGASDRDVIEVYERMKPHLYDGMPTKELYKLAFKELKIVSNSLAARYSLKRALQELGPAGYYFEQWIARFLQSCGYETMHNQLIEGYAVKHEADVIACNKNELIWIECKFRNTTDAKISVTTPMYVLSRVKDIQQKTYHLFEKDVQFTQGWLVTNAYLSSDSVAFAEYYGVKLLSWDYPKNNALKNQVDKLGLYPITCLTTISGKEKELLLSKGCLLVKDISEKPQVIDFIHPNPKKKAKVLQEVRELLNGYKQVEEER